MTQMIPFNRRGMTHSSTSQPQVDRLAPASWRMRRAENWYRRGEYYLRLNQAGNGFLEAGSGRPVPHPVGLLPELLFIINRDKTNQRDIERWRQTS